jgi:hypothetical protein
MSDEPRFFFVKSKRFKQKNHLAETIKSSKTNGTE